MSQITTVEETKRKLAELEQKIRAAKDSNGAENTIGEDALKDWQDMLGYPAQFVRKVDGSCRRRLCQR
jgi:hypothetical protein